MTRAFTLILILISSLNIIAQRTNCGCSEKEISLEKQYKCDTVVFSNSAKMYWQWNCDSSWLTFENKEKTILKSCKNETVYECERTGLNYLKEYDNYLLFQHKWISGCCTPPDLVFINKENGKEIKRITSELFIWGDIVDNYSVYFSDTTYTKLMLLNHITDNQQIQNFKNKEIENSVSKNQVIQLSNLFKSFEKNNEYLTFDFKKENGEVEKIKLIVK